MNRQVLKKGKLIVYVTIRYNELFLGRVLIEEVGKAKNQSAVAIDSRDNHAYAVSSVRHCKSR